MQKRFSTTGAPVTWALTSCILWGGCSGEETPDWAQEDALEGSEGFETDVDTGEEFRIKGGSNVPSNFYMTQATVTLPGCTGVIIGPRDILTAAHCNPQPGASVAFYSGPTSSGVTRTISWVKWPNGVDPDINDWWLDDTDILADVAYVRLTDDIPSFARIAHLPSVYPGAGQYVFQVGGGYHDGVGPSGTLRYRATLTVEDDVSDGRVFTEGRTVDGGDSGGPIYLLRVEHGELGPEVQGVLWGHAAGRDETLYTSIVYHRDFILGLMSKESPIGCYEDRPDRALPYFHPTRLSVFDCVQLCARRSSAFAGVQAGGQCFCGDNLGHAHLGDAACSWACDGGGTGCGGSWRNDIYVASDGSCPVFDPLNPAWSIACTLPPGEGDCDNDDECDHDSYCLHNVGLAFHPAADPGLDVCVHQGPTCSRFQSGVTDWNFCSTTCRCDVGQGHCDSDAECVSGLVCGPDRGADFGLDPAADVCMRPSAL